MTDLIKIEFPASRKDIALAMSAALATIGGRTVGASPELAASYAGHDGAKPVDCMAGSAASVAEALTSGFNVPGTAEDPADAELPAAPAGTVDARVDMKGVRFDANFCANAAEPFYSSGPQKGQWKAKRGNQDAYNAWYAQQLAAVTAAPSAGTPAHVVDDNTPAIQTGAAFGAVQQQPIQSSVQAPAPRTAGELMAWVSEQQVAGRLSQERINAAYAGLGIRITDLFPPTPENIVAQNVASLFRELSAGA